APCDAIAIRMMRGATPTDFRMRLLWIDGQDDEGGHSGSGGDRVDPAETVDGQPIKRCFRAIDSHEGGKPRDLDRARVCSHLNRGRRSRAIDDDRVGLPVAARSPSQVDVYLRNARAAEVVHRERVAAAIGVEHELLAGADVD